MSDNVIYVGENLANLIESPENDIEFDGVGIVSATLYFTCRWDVSVALVRGLNVHPDFSFLRRKKASVSRMEGKLAKVKVTYEGIDPSSGDEDNPESKTYALEGSTVREPIETHPKFKVMAGTSNDTRNENFDAIWAKEGEAQAEVFKKFGTNETALNQEHIKAGVKNFLSPSVVYTETRTYSRLAEEDIAVQLNNIGKIDVPPDSDVLPIVNPERNWLLLSANVVEIGTGIKVTRKWKMSGRRGWDNDIYGDGTGEGTANAGGGN